MNGMFLIAMAMVAVNGPDTGVQQDQLGWWSESVTMRCAKSDVPEQCWSSGIAAYSSMASLRQCRKELGGSSGDWQRTSQSSYEKACGDVLTVCKANWWLFYDRRKGKRDFAWPAKDVERYQFYIDGNCPASLPEVYVD